MLVCSTTRNIVRTQNSSQDELVHIHVLRNQRTKNVAENRRKKLNAELSFPLFSSTCFVRWLLDTKYQPQRSLYEESTSLEEGVIAPVLPNDSQPAPCQERERERESVFTKTTFSRCCLTRVLFVTSSLEAVYLLSAVLVKETSSAQKGTSKRR